MWLRWRKPFSCWFKKIKNYPLTILYSFMKGLFIFKYFNFSLPVWGMFWVQPVQTTVWAYVTGLNGYSCCCVESGQDVSQHTRITLSRMASLSQAKSSRNTKEKQTLMCQGLSHQTSATHSLQTGLLATLMHVYIYKCSWHTIFPFIWRCVFVHMMKLCPVFTRNEEGKKSISSIPTSILWFLNRFYITSS